MKGDGSVFIGKNRLVYILKELALSLGPGSFLSQIIDTKYHILRRNRNRSSVGRLQQVIRRQQKETAFRLGFHGQRQMHRHLVAVKVGIISSTYQRMQLNRFTFYQNRLECLNSQSVKRRSAVQHNRMLLDNILQHIPDLRLYPLHHLLRILNVVGCSVLHQFFHNERLEKLDRHLLGQTALIDLKLRPYDDNGTSGIVHTLSKQVLTETSRLTLQHIGKRLKRSVSRPCNRTAPAAVIDQGVYRLLQHPLLVSDDNVRRAQLKQTFQTIISIDNPPVQVVQV